MLYIFLEDCKIFVSGIVYVVFVLIFLKTTLLLLLYKICPFGETILLDLAKWIISPTFRILLLIKLTILWETFLAYVTLYVLESSIISIYQELANPSIIISEELPFFLFSKIRIGYVNS